MRTKFSGILTLLLAFVVQISFAQEKTVTGTITDNEGLPLPGVNILIEDSNTGTQSDFDGNYSIRVSEGETLVFSYVGFAEQKIQVGASESYNVTMKPSANEIDEVIVTSYRTTTRSKSSQAVTTISAENIEDRPNASIVQSMQGQVSGLNIGTNSGRPGANSTIILRGIGSINGNVEPLFIVDGIPVDEDNFRGINQNDVASIQVLKDAAATAIYGNRGANGVIIMTTKTGKYNQKLEFNYTSQYGVSALQPVNLELMNSRQKLTFERDNNIANSRGQGLTDTEIGAIADQANTYWTDYFFRKASTNMQNLSISTGSQNTNNFTSIGYLNQEGTFKASKLQRFNFRNNFTGRSADEKFTYSANLTLNFTKDDFSQNEGSRQIYFNPFHNALRGNPYLTPFDQDGGVTAGENIPIGNAAALQGGKLAPYVLLNAMKYNINRDEEIKAIGRLQADWNFAENWTVGGYVGIDYTSVSSTNLLHPNSILGPFQTLGDPRTEFGGLEDNSHTRDARFNALAKLNYNKTFDEVHTLDFSIYTEYLKSQFKGINFRQSGLNPKVLGTGAAYIDGTISEDYNGDDQLDYPYIPEVGRTSVQTGLFSYFGTVDYDYDGKYGFYGSIRRDASSRFISDQKWGTFWSVSGRWNLDQEDFMSDTAFNRLKLRLSYGTTGNERISGGYYGTPNNYLTTFATGRAYNSTQGYALSNLANTQLRWEETAQFNFGIDFGIWNNKLQGTLDIYNKKTTDLFQGRPLSPITGQQSLPSNIGSIVNNGVELSGKYTIYDKNDWNISVNANASYNKNEVKELAGANEDGIILSTGSTSLGEGQPVGSFYVVEYAGVNPSNGNALFYDADGNLTETYDPATDRKYVDKQQYPVWQGGFGFNVNYKGFSLSNQWVWFADIYRNNLDLADLEGSAGIDAENKASSLLRAWKQPGDITDIPRILGNYTGVDFINDTDRYLEDASYLRLRNIVFGYSFNKDQLSKLPFTDLRLFVQAENLITFTKWRGWDAESSFTATEVARYPTPRIYTLGVNLKF